MHNKQQDTESIEKLLKIMAALRDPHTGCPWDLEQDFASIAPYTIEEAYEVADAIERNAILELADELGDLLLQVVFHARMAEEAGHFDFGHVVARICDKMQRRHPHVFGDDEVADAKAQTESWEAIKSKERATGAQGLLDDVPVGLPALTRASKIGKRAARVGFDWPETHGVRAKLDEELAELDEALDRGDREAAAAELGDVLFALANLGRHLDLDPETCLRGANQRFSRRFAHVEQAVHAAGGDWSGWQLAALEELWQAAKALERSV